MQIVAASHLLTMNGPAIPGGALAHDDGQIIAIGTRAEMTALFAAPVADFPGSVIMPGLVNAHSHLELTHFPAWKIRKGLDYMPRTYVDWIIQVIKIARGLTGEERTISLKEGIAKSLEAGTTTIGEIVTDFSLLPTYAASPLKGRLLLEMIGQDPLQYKPRLAELDQLLAGFPAGRLLPGISPHAPHTVADTLCRELWDRAVASELPLVMHLAESAAELAFAHDSSGAIATLLYPFINWTQYLTPPRHTTPVHHLAALGVLGPNTVAVHGVHITPDDAELLQRHNVGVVLCPRSNDRLNVGRAPVAMYRKLGIRLALGTDSLASNDSLSLWDELRFLQAAFSGAFTADEALALATINGARLLKIDHQTGSLATGKAADFIVVQPDRLPATAATVAEALINGNRVLKSYIDGTPC